MVNQKEPKDYVIGTGELHSVRDLCELVFGYLDLDYHDYVIQDPQFYRPIEKYQLVANPRKAYEELEWKPKVSFDQMIKMMVDADLHALTTKSP